MLIKATRVRVASGAGALVRHLLAGDDNEETIVVRGTVGDLTDAVDDARRFGRVYALRHFVIAPAIAMTREEFERAARALGEEFGFNPDLALVVEHKKARAVDGAADRHWHVVVAETNAATGRVLSSRFDHARHEKLSRTLEVMFGHPIVPGAHDGAVLAALRAEGKGNLADQLGAALVRDERPIAAFSSELHQAAKRQGIDLAIVRDAVRAACADAPSVKTLRDRLATHGLTIEPGDKAGVWVLRGPEGQFLGAAHRLSGLRKAEFQTIMETNHDHDDAAERSAVDPQRHAGPAAGHGDDPAVGAGHGPADAGRGHVGAGRGDRPAQDRGATGGAGGPEPAGAPSTFRGAGHRPGVAENAGRGLTAAVANFGHGIFALSRTFVGMSPAQRAHNDLAEEEQKLQARIAATRKVNQTISPRLHAARMNRDGAQKRHDAALRAYRAAQEQLAAALQPRRSVMDHLLGRQPVSGAAEALERHVAAARNDLVAAEQSISSAEVNLARVERAEAGDRQRRMDEAETERRTAMELLAEVLMAQRVARAFPVIVYSGPAFVRWAGGRIERKRRRGLRNPNAVNIWGLPIDPGY